MNSAHHHELGSGGENQDSDTADLVARRDGDDLIFGSRLTFDDDLTIEYDRFDEHLLMIFMMSLW